MIVDLFNLARRKMCRTEIPLAELEVITTEVANILVAHGVDDFKLSRPMERLQEKLRDVLDIVDVNVPLN